MKKNIVNGIKSKYVNKHTNTLIISKEDDLTF